MPGKGLQHVLLLACKYMHLKQYCPVHMSTTVFAEDPGMEENNIKRSEKEWRHVVFIDDTNGPGDFFYITSSSDFRKRRRRQRKLEVLEGMATSEKPVQGRVGPMAWDKEVTPGSFTIFLQRRHVSFLSKISW